MARKKQPKATTAAPAKQRRARKPAAVAAQARRTPDKGPQHYRADTYHEIEAPGGGVMCVNPGDHVVPQPDGSIAVMPPERYEEATRAAASE